MRNRRVLVTGPSGQIAGMIARALAPDNEVWGIARFGDESVRGELEAAGVRTRRVDLAGPSPDLGALPDDFDHVLHLAAHIGTDLDTEYALRVNALGTGRLMGRVRGSGSVLVFSTASVYRPHPDPWHPYTESDPLGDGAQGIMPTYSISKIAQETVARYCAEAYDLPTVIGRIDVAYGRSGGLPAIHMRRILAGEPVVLRHDPAPYSPIHDADVVGQLDGLLAAAAVDAPAVNYCGDETVTAQDWCRLVGELHGVEPRMEIRPVAGTQLGVAADPTLRRQLGGPTRTSWRDGVRDMYEAHTAGAPR